MGRPAKQTKQAKQAKQAPLPLPLLVAWAVAVACGACSTDSGSHAGGTSPGQVVVGAPSPTATPTGTPTAVAPAAAQPANVPVPGAGTDGSALPTLPSGASGAGGMDSSADAAMQAGEMTSMADAGTGPTPAAAIPSAGCSAGAGRPAGGVVSAAGSHHIRFPGGYDGAQAYPVLMGFHGCGGVNRGTGIDDTEWMRLTAGTAFEDDYVRVVPLSNDAGGCWSYDTDIGRVTAIYDELLADHCVDTSRVFATGHSSGAQFIVQIVTQPHTADGEHLGLRALAPVAASDYGAIAGPVPVLYIQGQMDKERGNGDGRETVERFRVANSCGDSSMPYSQVAGCQSGSTTVNPGCIAYGGCQAMTVWCSHDDPAYNGTMHGVPCFAMTAMHDFFGSFE